MNYSHYISILKVKLKDYFDVYENYEMDNYILPLVAKSVIRNERYAFSKKFVLDAYENFEYSFIYCSEANVNNIKILDFINLLKSNIDKIVDPNEEHMSSSINGIYISNTGFSQEAIRVVEKFKFRKSFFFGLRGWCDISLVLVDLSKKEVYTNKQGKNLKDFYKSILKS
ncbi:MAG TPA: hypothetical protein VK071_11565 [Tissierellales bacterium]|nr:hypothetical protein [Tissierellales bacterium]